MALKFRILHQSKKSRARVCQIETAHGVIDTPAFVPVATNGALKGPNRLGFDLFAFDVDSNDKIIPPKTFGGGGDNLVTDDGESGTTNDCSIKKKGNKYNGFGCTIFAMNDQNPDNTSVSYWKNLPK